MRAYKEHACDLYICDCQASPPWRSRTSQFDGAKHAVALHPSRLFPPAASRRLGAISRPLSPLPTATKDRNGNGHPGRDGAREFIIHWRTQK